jgi:hypothetical protein
MEPGGALRRAAAISLCSSPSKKPYRLNRQSRFSGELVEERALPVPPLRR